MRVFLAICFVVAAFPVEVYGGSTSCVDPDDGACFPTIQAAVDAASVDGVIEVRARADGGSYNESVVINTAGLTIEGETPPAFTIVDFADLLAVDWVNERTSCPAITVDACETAALGEACGFYTHPTATDEQRSAFVVNALNVTIRHLTIRHALDAIRFNAGSSGGTVELNCFISDRRAVYAGNPDGPDIHNITVQRNRLFGVNAQEISGSALTIYGDGAQAMLNLLRLSEGIRISGASATIQLNAIHLAGLRSGIQAEHGSGHVVTENWIEGTNGTAIRLIEVSNGLVADNRIIDIPDDASGVTLETSTNSTIENNFILATSNPGIALSSSSDSNVIQTNTLDSIGSDTSDGCIQVFESDNNQILNNTMSLCSIRGVRVDFSDSTTVTGNDADWNGTSGVFIGESTNTTVHDNTLDNNQGEGFSQTQTATGTVFTDNNLSGNLTDVCNDGTFTTFTGNVFVTGGDTTPCVVEAGND